VPHSGQKYRVKVAPESLGLSKDLVCPVRVSAPAGTSATLACPEPVARWQSRHEHISIDTTGPRIDISTWSQAHRAVTSMVGRFVLLMA
jgi:hypothetical protein